MLLALGLDLPLVQAYAADTELHFITHEFPPLNFSRNGEVTGLAADVMRELQRRTDTQDSFEVVPFARGYMTATSMPNVVFFFVARSPDRERLFQWVGPIANVSTSFYVSQNATVKIDSMDDARHAPSIFVHHGSHPDQLLRQLGFSNIRQANSTFDAIRMLLLPGNENDIALMTDIIVPDMLERLKLPSDALRAVYPVDKLQAYIAFSKGTPAAVVANFQRALDDIKRDGSFAAIHAKWLPHEKPPGLNPDASRAGR
ncbi:MAG: transporter substrate-binding domain-containing protein [Burkholderiaceae bacterium]|nr:transporter substrate-binding domain-containing protein [Burkholderiaceae bacterium]